MKSYNIGLRAVAILLLLAAFTQTGCKETTVVNANVAPNIDHITVFDTTLSSISRSIYDSNINTSTYYGFSITLGCGSVNDPFFGKTDAGIFFQVDPPNTNLNFGNKVIDSAVLVLPYGNLTAADSTTSSTQTYTVYRVTDVTFTDSTTGKYFAYSNLPTDQNAPLSSPTTINVRSMEDSIYVDGAMQAPHLRIKLNSNFTTAITDTSNGHYSNFANFRTWFNGLYVQSSSSSASEALPYFRLDESGAGTMYSRANVILYYRNSSTDTTEQSMSYPFATNDCAFFNKISRDYTGAPAQQYILPASAYNSNINNEFVPLQSQPGASIDFKIYGIQSLPKSIVNEAQIRLSLPTSSGSATSFKALPNIYVFSVDNNGGVTSVLDYQPVSSSYLSDFVNGTLTQINGVSTYTLNIPRTLQNAINQGSDTLHLRITGGLGYYGAFGVNAAGGNYPDPALRLRMYVIYTKQK